MSSPWRSALVNSIALLFLTPILCLAQSGPTTYNINVRPGVLVDLDPKGLDLSRLKPYTPETMHKEELLRLQVEEAHLRNQLLQDQVQQKRALAKPSIEKWHVNVKVTSNPPGCPVEVNGSRAGTTPTILKLQVGKAWVGVASVPGGWAYGKQLYEVSVLPPDGGPRGLNLQTKRIQPGLSPKGSTMHFELRSRPGPSAQPTGAQELDVRLRKLKKLFDEGLIDQQDYDRQRKVILSDL